MDVISIDGSMGEGGGQILRTSLALSTCLGRPFRIFNIRSSRRNPGLQPQHLAAVSAAAAISQARVEGDKKDSQTLTFTPSQVRPGRYHFSVGTAGSTLLVLQTVLPALMQSNGPSHLILEGGTHNPMAPPFDFLQYTFLPVLSRMGPVVRMTLERPGFAPRGGGKMAVDIQPVSKLKHIRITERGEILAQHGEVMLSHLPEHIARRELEVIQHSLGYADEQLQFQVVSNAYGPGNVVSIFIQCENITECFSAFGQRGVSAEEVAKKVVEEVRRYLKAGVPVGHYLADQLLLPMALAGGGMFVTEKPSLHTLTNLEVIKAFMKIDVRVEEVGEDKWRISIAS